jgi:hypothetical protein
MKKFEQGKLVMWVNSTGKRIIWMVADDKKTGMVVHSDELVSIGTLTDLTATSDIVPFVGGVTINSAANS